MATSSSQTGVNIDNNSKPEINKAEKDLSWYLPLYKAALKGDWEGASRFFVLDPDAVTAKITRTSETVLHRAVGTGKAIHFVKKLLELIPPNALTLKNQYSDTVLHFAAKFGNTEAAKLLVAKNPHLPNTWNDTQLLPLHVAGLFGHKEMVLFLLTVTKDDVEPSPFAEEPGVRLLNIVIVAGFYDVALHLVRRYPKLATWRYSTGVPVKLENFTCHPNGGDLDNPADSSQVCAQMCCHGRFRRYCFTSVPCIKHIHDTKLMHHQALQLVRCLCMEVIGLDNLKADFIVKPPVLSAARLGIHEVVEEILKSLPTAIWSLDKEQHDVFQLAVINRRETVFNLLYQMNEHKHLVTQISDIKENNILHLAGKLAPPHRLTLVSGAALQMQRELQWYKEVEKVVQPNYREKQNSAGKTPAMVFTEEHKDLVREGETWMKDTAKSCTITVALVATVAFAAAITVPGGNNGDNGLPIFSKVKAFIIFAISDAISLFSSIASMLMFLSIRISRCAEADFFHALPKRLIIGLVTLFLSIASMMIAFGATLYIMFGHKTIWILISVVALACLPVTLFVSLQFPLLVDMIKSTYGPGIFCMRSELPFY
ncbi:hypothetical protein L1049_020673 [Liquidambar formosana]|uniref:PGG domain-containing protein n=1 Tax=Liquidambar formosana TaxID=63359 RepID=A0AAP0SBP8_LIQFO